MGKAMTDYLFAAIVHSDDRKGDSLLQELIRQRMAQGWKIRGLITARGKDPNGQLPMQIADLYRGQTYDISQSLGSGSLSCSLDHSGLATASAVLRDALAEKPDLVVVNRFGPAEAAGRGFHEEMLALMSAAIPLLTLTRAEYAEDWHRFTGDFACILPLENNAIDQWLDALPRTSS